MTEASDIFALHGRCWRTAVAICPAAKQVKGGDDRHAGERIQTARGAARFLLQITKHGRGKKTVQVADRVDKRNTGSDDTDRQRALRHRPKECGSGFRADAGNAHGDKTKPRVAQGRQESAERGHQHRQHFIQHMTEAIADFSHQIDGDDGAKPGNSGQQADTELAKALDAVNNLR